MDFMLPDKPEMDAYYSAPYPQELYPGQPSTNTNANTNTPSLSPPLLHPETPEAFITAQAEKLQNDWESITQRGRQHQLEVTITKLRAVAQAAENRAEALEKETRHLKAALARGIFRGFANSYRKMYPNDQAAQAAAAETGGMALSVTIIVNEDKLDATSGQVAASATNSERNPNAAGTTATASFTSSLSQSLNPANF